MGSREIILDEVITDIAAGPFGSNLKVSCFVESGFPIIDGANLKGFKVTDNLTKFVTEEKARSLSRSIAKRGDVVVTISGTLGQIAYVPNNSAYPEYLCSQRQFRVSFDQDVVYVPYLVYYFHTKEGQSKILAFANQTGVPALSQPTKNFRAIRLNLPSLDEQRRIARIGELLNAKVELNQQINDYLLQAMETLYREYFTYDNQSYGSIYDIAEIVYGAPFSSKRFNETGDGWPLIRIRDLTTFSPQFFTAEAHPKRTFIEPGDVVAGMDADFTPTLWLGKKAVLNQRVCEFVPPVGSLVTKSYLLCATKPLLAYVQNYATGTTVAHLGKGDLEALEVPLPREDDLVAFGRVCEPMREAIVLNAQESIQLAELRDALLPKLMSGEIDVSEVELPTQPNNHLHG